VLAGMRLVAASSGASRCDLQIRRVTPAFAGFLTWAGFPRFAFPGSRTPDFSGFSLADPLAACGLPHDAAEPSSRRSGVNG
jgi:hypothetical protein